MTNVIAVEKMAELMQQMEENSPRVAALQYCLKQLEAKCAALAAENAGLKEKGRELLKEAAYVYSHYNRMVDHLDGESIDGQTLHELQEVIEKGTPTTDAYMSERGE